MHRVLSAARIYNLLAFYQSKKKLHKILHTGLVVGQKMHAYDFLVLTSPQFNILLQAQFLGY